MTRRNLILLVVLIGAAVWRWSPTITSGDVLPDEQVYLRAARHLAAGESPYAEPGYFYPPPLAALVSELTAHVGEIDALRLLRGLALAGVILSVWLSLRLVSWPRWAAAAFAALYVAFAPAVDIATALGNAAGLATGLVLLGLVGWEKRPIAAGICLGLGLAIKPIAPIAPILLALHRPVRANRRHLVTAAVSMVVAASACLPQVRHLRDLLANASGHTNPYNFSLHKLLSDLGLPVAPLVLLGLVGAAAVVAVRRRRLAPIPFLVVAVTANLLALPILWAHSLLLFLPVQLLAIEAGLSRFRAGDASGRSSIGPVLAALALSATFLAQAVGTTYGLPAWTALVTRAAPLAAIPFLGWFVLQDFDRKEVDAPDGPPAPHRHPTGE